VIQILMGWDGDHLHPLSHPWPRLRHCLYRRTELRRGRRCRTTVVVRVPSNGAVSLRIRFYGWMADRGAGRAGNPGSTARESSYPRLYCRPTGWSPGRLRRTAGLCRMASVARSCLILCIRPTRAEHPDWSTSPKAPAWANVDHRSFRGKWDASATRATEKICCDGVATWAGCLEPRLKYLRCLAGCRT